VAVGATVGVSTVVPPFRREDDDTLREFVPVALTYSTWAATTLVVAVVGWRRIHWDC
jgi:hypothetical protein